MLPWKDNEKLIEALYNRLQALEVEIEGMKKEQSGLNVLAEMKKIIVAVVASELKAILTPELIATITSEVKKSLNPPKPQGVV